MYVLNIIVRALVALVGLSIALGYFTLTGMESPLQETFGVVVLLFGVYRVVNYISRSRQHEQDEDE